MENESKTPLQELNQASLRPAPSVIPDGQFRFEPIEELFETPEEKFNDYAMSGDLAADDISGVNLVKSDIDKYGIGAMASLGIADPGTATDTYNPIKQNRPDNNENTFSMTKRLLTLDDTPVSEKKVAPAFSGMRQTQFMRYYEHPEFNNLGYSPYANMENYYNENSTIYDDMARMRGNWWSLVGTGLDSVYGSMFSGGDFLEPDLDSATAFEDKMGIMSSTRGGFGGFVNNLAANSAYTGGILISIAAEELILAGVTALSGGTAAPVTIAKTGANVVKGAKAIFSFTKMFEKTRKILSKAKELETARDFWVAANGGRKMVAGALKKGFTPNTYKAFKEIKTAKNAGQNMSNLAKMNLKFGGFYRDMRAVNLAASEAKLEAGMAYNQVLKNGMNNYSAANGGKSVDEYEMSRISNAASQAAFKTMIANAPLIYASNWLVLGNALGGFQRGVQRTLGSAFGKGITKNVINTAGKKVVDAAGKVIKNPFKYLGGKEAGFLGLKRLGAKIKAAGGWKSVAGSGSIVMLDYFAANVAEGIQEVSQEAISAATVGYYTEILQNPAQGGVTLQNQMILSAMGDQFSSEGAGVFMSGFLMGGLVQPVQSVFMQGVPSVYKYGLQEAGIGLATKKQKETYAEFRKTKDEMIERIVDSYNKSWNSQAIDPSELFDVNRLNFMVQKEMAEKMKDSTYRQDFFGFKDAADSAKFQQFYTMFETNGTQNFRNQLQGFLEMSDAEMIEAFPGVSKKDQKDGKLRQRINDTIIQMDKMEENYNKLKDKYVNPFDENKYNRKTQEKEYINELVNRAGYDHARYLYMFTNEGFMSAVERADGIYSKLQAEPLFQKMAASDITTLLDPASIEREIIILEQEIEAFEGTPEGAATAASPKKEKINRLKAIQKIVNDPKNRFKNGTFKRNKALKDSLRSEFKNYVRFLAKNEGSFINEDNIDSALTDIVDYYALNNRAKVYDKAIEFMNNPEKFAEMVARSQALSKNRLDGRIKETKAALEKYTDIILANQLVNDLSKDPIGAYADEGQMALFLQTGDSRFLINFYDENGEIIKGVHDVKYKMIQRLIEVYNSTRSDQTTEKDLTEDQKEDAKVNDVENQKSDIEMMLENAGIELSVDTITISPYLDEVLRNAYRKYKARMAASGKPSLSAQEWKSTAEALDLKNVFNAIKQVWAAGAMTQNPAGETLFASPIEQSLVDSDTGFKEFLSTPKQQLLAENPLITSILNQSTITLDDIFEQPNVAENTEVTGGQDPVGEGVVADLYKREVKTSGEETIIIYELLDKKGNKLSPEILDFVDEQFDSLRGTFNESQATEAYEALKAIDSQAPDSTPFEFDGVDGLFYGMTIYKGSEKYIIIQKPNKSKTFGKNQKLRVIKASNNVGPISERKFEYIKQGEFSNVFTQEEITMDVLDDTVSKLDVNSLLSPYAHANRADTKGMSEDAIASMMTSQNAEGKERLKIILKELTTEEREQLEFVVYANPNPTTVNDYVIRNMSGVEYKSANPLIKRYSSEYVIGIRINNTVTQERINAKLIEQKVDPSDSPDGIFAYMNNASFLIKDQLTGADVDPRTMNLRQAQNVMYSAFGKTITTEEQLKEIQKAFILNSIITTTFNNLGVDGEKQFFGVNDLPFNIDLNQKGGRTVYSNGNPVFIEALDYQYADENNNYFVFDLKYDKGAGGRIYNYSSTAEDSVALEKQILLQLEKQGVNKDTMLAGKDRYLAAVKLPNGQYRLVNLKAVSYTKLERDELFVEVINKSKEIQKIKDAAGRQAAAFKYNEELQEKLFLSSARGNQIELNIGEDGSIYLSLDRTVGEENESIANVGIDVDVVNSETDAVKIIESLFTKYNGTEVVNDYDAKIRDKNIRKSFPTGAPTQDIIDKSTTEVAIQVATDNSLVLSAEADAINAQRAVAFASIKPKNEDRRVEDEAALPEIAEEAEDSTADMSDDEIQKRVDNDFNSNPLGIEHIINKELRGEELNDAEKKMMNNPVIANGVNIRVSLAGGRGSLVPEGKTKETSLDKEKAKLKALRDKLIEGKKGVDKIDALDKSPEYQKQLALVKKLSKTANKLVEATTETERIEDYNEFLDWANESLPSIIGIEDILTLADNGISKGYKRVGAFVLDIHQVAGGVSVNGTVYVGANNPFKYHEAFHGVFRMLLTQEQIDRYRKFAKIELKAKYGSQYKTELEKFRTSAKQYEDMSDLELENEFAEEYMADEFEAFKKDPRSSKTNTEIKSFFTKIIEWIKGVLGKYTSNELLTLYENIDAGKFKSATLQQNEFTSLAGITVANALVRHDVVSKDEDVSGFLYLDSDVVDPLIRSMAGMFISKVNEIEEPTYNPNDVYNDLSRDFRVLLDPDDPSNKILGPGKVKQLQELEDAFTNYPEDIKKEVFALINIISDQDSQNELNSEIEEDGTGVRKADEFDKDASEIGGFNSLAQKVRAYIATTTMVGVDFFGKTELKDGVPLIVPVKFNEAYNGLLKAVSNISDPIVMLRRMYTYSRLNPNMSSVVDKLFNDANLDLDTLASDTPFINVSNPNLLQSMLKGFENYKVDYLFNERDGAGNILIYTASERDDINAQLDEWSQAYIFKRKQMNLDASGSRIEDLLALVKNMENILGSKTKNKSNEATQKLAVEHSEKLFELTGIRLSPMFLNYSYVKTFDYSKLDAEQKILYNSYSIEPISEQFLVTLYDLMYKDSNIFSKKSDGMASRLTYISLSNAALDESIGASSFINPNGDLVYGHQLPTYHLKAVAQLNNSNILDKFSADKYLDRNYLLNNVAFLNLSDQGRIKVTRIAGSKIKSVVSTDLNNDAQEDILNTSLNDSRSTQSFGEFTPQEFAVSLINNYVANFNRRSGKNDMVDGVGQIPTATAPVFLRVMEAANTGDLVSLPIIKAVTMKGDNVELTPQLVNAFINRIASEFERINREAIAFEEFGDNIAGYNDSMQGRAFSFVNTGLLLDPLTQQTLANVAITAGKAKQEMTFEQGVKLALGISTSGIRAEVENGLNEAFAGFDAMLNKLQVKNNLSTQVRQGLTIGEGVARTMVDIAGSQLNLNTNESHNLQQIFFNNWINAASINDLLLGDQAVSLQSMIDKVKRAKLNNSAYYSASSLLVAPELGINHSSTNFDMYAFDEIQEVSSLTGNNIDSADAQAYITTKGSRYATFAFGRLSPSMAGMYDTLDRGEAPTSDDVFGTSENPIGFAKKQDLINSKKYVYMDGKTAIKMSVTVLTKEYTSNYNAALGKWEAKPTMKQLHYLREQMEANEDANNNFAMAAPLSAVKMMKSNINKLNDDSSGFDTSQNLTSTNLRTEYLGLQVVQPSNKMEITDMTQIKDIITSEQDDLVEIPGMGLNEKGQVMRVGDVRRLYNEAISKRVTLKYKNKRNLIFTFDTALDEFKLSKKKGAITPNLAAFLNYAQGSLKASGSASNLLEFFGTEGGEQKYNLNNPFTAKKYEQLFLSYFSKGTLREKIPGTSLALVSSFGTRYYRMVYEVKNGIPVRSEIIRQTQWKGGDAVETMPGDGVYPNGQVVIDVLRTGLMDYTDPTDPSTSTGERYSEVVMPAMDKNVMDLIANTDAKIPDAISKMFGVRIPTQDKHSAVNMKVVDFMPAYYGSSAIFPKELVEVSGADFDIDKVYAKIKEYYLDSKNNFVAYGKGDPYTEYVLNINKLTAKEGTTYNSAAKLFNNDEIAIRLENSLTPSEMNRLTDPDGANRFTEDSLRAALVLGLPSTKAKFDKYVKKHGTPNEAILNNDILDYNYALAGNTGMTGTELSMQENKSDLPIAYQAADIEVLKTAFDELVNNENIQLFKGRQDSPIDIDTLTGMIQSFEANKGSAIGAVVLPNAYLNLLTEYKIELFKEVRIGNNKYPGFGGKLINGERKQDIISSLVTMETDNAKERFIAKLGLNRHAVGMAANMTSLGIPLKTTLLLLNSAEVRDLYDLSMNKKDKMDPGLDLLLESRIGSLDAKIKAEADKTGKKTKFVSVTDELLESAVDSTAALSDNQRIQILYLFNRINKIKKWSAKMRPAVTLSQGLPKDVPTIKKNIKDLQDLFGPFAQADVSAIFKSKTWQSNNLKIFSQIYQELLPNTLLTMSPEFGKMLDPVLENLDTDSDGFTFESQAQVEQDLLSYLTIKSYQHLLNNSSSNAAPVTNNLIYPGPINTTDLSIVKMIRDEKLRRSENNEESNFFLDSFVGTEYANDQGNNTGLNIATSNTWRRLNAANMIDLQTSFAKLYGGLETRDLAVSILHYMMIKDGLQLKYGSLMKAMSPFVIEKYLNNVNTVELALKQVVPYEKAFGLSYEDLANEFKEGYLQSNPVGPLLNNYGVGDLRNGTGILNIIETFDAVKNEFVIKDGAYGENKKPKDYVRLSIPGKVVSYRLFKLDNLDERTATYKEVPSMGSNQQFAAGFVGGPRLTYKQTRSTKTNNDVAGVAPSAPTQQTSESAGASVGTDAKATQEKQDVLRTPGAIVEVTNKSVVVKEDPDAPAVNIADPAKALEALSKLTASGTFDEAANANIENNSQQLDGLTDEQQSEADILKEDLKQSEEVAEAEKLEDWWEANVSGNTEAENKMKEQGMASLEDALLIYGDLFSQTTLGEQELIERLKCFL